MKKEKLVSIIIPTHNRKKMLQRLLKSILISNYKNLEIIVVDDASSDGTSEFIREKFIKNKKIKIIRNKKNLFASASRNVGLTKAKGEYVFFVDDDNVLPKNTINILINTFESDDRIGEVGPVIYNFHNKNKIQWIRARRNMWTSKTYHDNNSALLKGKDIIETIDIPNAYILRRSLLVKNNIKFRKIFGIMYEESDIAYRIRKLGYKIVVNRNAKIYHDLEEDNFILDSRRPFVFSRNRILFHKLYSSNIFQFISVAFFWSFLFAGYYIYSIFYSKKSNTISFYKKVVLSFRYLNGTLTGIFLALKGDPIV